MSEWRNEDLTEAVLADWLADSALGGRRRIPALIHELRRVRAHLAAVTKERDVLKERADREHLRAEKLSFELEQISESDPGPDCWEHASNCCSDWCRYCQAGMARKSRARSTGK